MQKREKLKKIGIWLGSISIILMLVLFLMQQQLTGTPWVKEIALEATSNIVTDMQGDYLVIDQGSSRVSSISKDGEWLFSMHAGNNSSKSFQNALGVYRNQDGEIFIRDVVWKSNGMDVDSERILQYSAVGKFEKIVYSVAYPSNENTDKEGVYKPRIYGPFYYQDTFYVLEVKNNAILLKNMQDDTTVRTVYYASCGKVISDLEMGTDGLLYFVDKRGMVLHETGTGILETVYQGYGDIGADCSLAWDFSINQSGECVFTDLGKRTIEELHADGSISERVGVGEVWGASLEAFGDNPIYYRVHLGNDGQISIAYDDSIFVKAADDTVLLNNSLIPIAKSAITWRWTLFCILVLAIVFAVAAIICLTIVLLHGVEISAGTKIACIVLFSMLAASAIVASISFKTTNQQYIEMVFDRMLIAAQDVSEVIDTTALESIDSPDDYYNTDYMTLKRSLESVVNKKYSWNRDIYCNIYRYKDSVLYAPIYLDQSVGAFYPLPIYDQIDALESGTIQKFYMTQTSSGMWMYVYVPLYNAAQEIIGIIDVGMDMNSYVRQTRTMYVHVMFSVLAACIIMQMLIIQATAFYEFYRKRKRLIAQNGGKLEKEPIGFLQPIVFVVFFAFNLPTAFLPNYSTDFYVSLWGLPKEFVVALPISLNLLATAVSSLASSFVIERIGSRKVGVFGTLLTAVAYIGVAFAEQYISFLAAMLLAGAGLGTVLNAVNSYIAMQKDETERAAGFTMYNAAFFGGFNCGTVVGALLASTLGMRVVFLTVALCMAIPLLLILKFMHIDSSTNSQTHEKELSSVSVLRFLFNPKILLFLVFGYIPYMIAGHFLYYFLPIFGISIGLTETIISQLMLVNGVCVLMLTWLSNEVFIKRLKLRTSVICALLILALAFLVFAYLQSVVGVIITIVFISLANSFGASAMSLYFSEQKLTQSYGNGKAMGIFSLFENIGDTAGPFVFSFILAGSLMGGFQVLAMAYGVAAAIFLLSSVGRKRKTQDQSSES